MSAEARGGPQAMFTRPERVVDACARARRATHRRRGRGLAQA
jgi:hypothetical protein